MGEVVHFQPRAEANADQNLHEFIRLCREDSTALGSLLIFDDNVWEVGQALALKGKTHEQRIVFSSWATAAEAMPVSMSEPFLSFAKAYLRYQHGARKTKAISGRLAALRALEAALIEGGAGANPTACRPDILNRAAQLLRDRFSASGAYRLAAQLVMLADFMVRHNLTTIGFDWRNPVPRPLEGPRVGKEFDERRQKKMPSPAALYALAKVFQLADTPSDILVSSATAIMCAAPDRVNEVLGLRLGCEVNQKIPSTGELAYGLRWWSSKGADPMIKWIVNSMADVVQDAIKRIVQVTEEARKVAKWYTANPSKLYLPMHLEHLRDSERLTIDQISEVLFVDQAGIDSTLNWCKTNAVPLLDRNGKATAAFSEVQRAVIHLLPRQFPIIDAERGLVFSEALFIVRRNELHGTRPTYRCIIEAVSQGSIYQRLGARSESGIQSIFDKFSLTEDDGTRIRLTSHQFRHYLNTLAQAGGLSQLDIAKWSGRKDIGQNSAYNHTSDRDVLALVREAVGGDLQIFGPTTKTHRVALIPRDEFDGLKLQTAHTTDYGYCLHDFTMLPCPQHMDCTNCEEQICIKGEDASKEANIRAQRRETEHLLQLASVADKEGDAGADRWVEHQRLTLTRLDQLCAILDDDRVPRGSAIRLTGLAAPSAIELAIKRRLSGSDQLALPSSTPTEVTDVDREATE